MNLFQMIDDQLSGIVQQITQQSNIVEQSITSPLKSIVSQVTGGIWKGDGANRFASEMTEQVLPMLASLMTINTNYAGAIQKGQNRMAQAVQEATQAANTLNDVFSAIF